ncbi:hypothetical protein, partial [Propionivibrio sp.]|uniref:hypothetical protein n=1 Tax=Propionivibrio sp. TaxID=2212460 RepID=UPI00262DA540
MADTLQQLWQQQYEALNTGAEFYKSVVNELGRPENLTTAQTTVLQSSQRGQLDTEYQITQFLSTDQRLLVDADKLSRRLQNDATLSVFQRDQLQRQRDQLISEAGDFGQLRSAKGWTYPGNSFYVIGGKRYDNTGAPPVWDWMSTGGQLGQTVDNFLSNLQSAGQWTGDVLRPFFGGATNQEAGTACAGLVNWLAGESYGKLFRAPSVPGATPNAQFFSDALFADTQGKAIELSFKPGENVCRMILPKDSFKSLIRNSGILGWSTFDLDLLPESITIELPVEQVRTALAQESTALWLSEGITRDPAQRPLLLASLDTQYQTFETMTDVNETFWDVALNVTPSVGTANNAFTVTTTTTLSPSQTDTPDPTQSISANTSTLISTGTYLVNGLGDVNTATGNTAYANNLITGGIRPGEQNLVNEILGSQLAENFLANPNLVNSPVWAPDVNAVAMNILATGVQYTIPT